MQITEMAKRMLAARLSSKPVPATLEQELCEYQTYYLIAKSDTSHNEWTSKQFEPYVVGNTLVVFLSEDEAQVFANHYGCVDNNEPMVSKTDKAELLRVVAEYTDNRGITALRVYSVPPVYIDLQPSLFLSGHSTNEADASIDSDAKHTEINKEVLLGVEQVKQALDTFEPNARRKLDPGQRYENIHTLVQTLVQQNNIEYDDLDSSLDLPKGYTREFCVSANSTHPSMEVMEKYLSYFGLNEYLFVYKKNSVELINYLNARKDLDKYELSSKIKPENDRYKLQKITRGTDSSGHFVYKLVLVCGEKTVSTVISNPLNRVVGREYAIVGLEQQGSSGKDVLSAPDISEGELSGIAKSLDKAPAEKTERTYEDRRKDAILFYFKRMSVDRRSAEAKYKELEIEPDVLDEFYKYIDSRQFGRLEIAGYSARKLIREMHMEPYEAYLALVQLRTDPQNTKQRLKYRETDPQYQVKK